MYDWNKADAEAALLRTIFGADEREIDSLLSTGQHGISVDYRDQRGRSLLLLAAADGNAPWVTRLLAAGASVNDRVDAASDASDRTPLLSAITRGHLDVAEVLLEAGADPRIPDIEGRTPLHVLVKNYNPALVTDSDQDVYRRSELVRLLIERGCPVNQRDDSGRTALMYTLSTKVKTSGTYHIPLSIVSALMSGGANPNIEGPGGRKILHNSWAPEQMEFIKLMVESGADLNARDWKGETPLHYMWSLSVLQHCVAIGLDLLALDREGRNYLHHMLAHSSLAAAHGPIPVYLVRCGINPRHPDFIGETALDILERFTEKEYPKRRELLSAIAAMDAKTAMRTAAPKAALPIEPKRMM